VHNGGNWGGTSAAIFRIVPSTGLVLSGGGAGSPNCGGIIWLTQKNRENGGGREIGHFSCHGEKDFKKQ